jgi:hypothetical protein
VGEPISKWPSMDWTRRLKRSTSGQPGAGNYPSIRIIEQIAGEIRKVEICLVPCRDYIAEADAVLGRPHQERPEPLPEFDEGEWPA